MSAASSARARHGRIIGRSVFRRSGSASRLDREALAQEVAGPVSTVFIHCSEVSSPAFAVPGTGTSVSGPRLASLSKTTLSAPLARVPGVGLLARLLDVFHDLAGDGEIVGRVRVIRVALERRLERPHAVPV